MHLDWLFVMGETVLGCLAPPLLLALQFAVFFLRIGEDEVQGGAVAPNNAPCQLSRLLHQAISTWPSTLATCNTSFRKV